MKEPTATMTPPLPDGLPPLPPVPNTYDQWAYRGMGWHNNRNRTTYCHWLPGWEGWHMNAPDTEPTGYPYAHYLEAVRDATGDAPRLCDVLGLDSGSFARHIAETQAQEQAESEASTPVTDAREFASKASVCTWSGIYSMALPLCERVRALEAENRALRERLAKPSANPD